MSQKPIIYVKDGCPWCDEALSYFSTNKVELDVRDVNTSHKDKHRMMELTGQSLTPCFEFGDFVVADFSVDEFKAAVDQKPDVKQQLGL